LHGLIAQFHSELLDRELFHQVAFDIIRTSSDQDREGDLMASDRPTVAGAGETHTSMTRQQMVDFFKRRWESYEDLDAAALAADYADDAIIESPTTGVHTGRDAAERTFRIIFTAFLDLTTTVDNLIIDGDSVVTVLSLEGTHIGEFLGIPPTGKRFTMPAVFFYQLENGKIVRERRIYDFTGLLVQIGVLKAKPA
jgi:steroid delta-isomerase-like uncharacterized protein